MSLSSRCAPVLAAALLLAAGCLPAAPAQSPPPPPTADLAALPDLVAPVMVDAALPPQPKPDLAVAVEPRDLAMRPAVGGQGIDPLLAARELDYAQALRTAALKLLGDLPSADDLHEIEIAKDPQKAYQQRIAVYVADPRFPVQLIAFFRNAFKMGGALPNLPSLETAPVFAARLVVEGRPFTEVVTATTNTCPTYANGSFVNGECQNGVAPHAGVLSNPGVQAHFFSNMAFRRARWVQETFSCRKFPAEYSPAPQPVGGGLYTAPWPFTSITGGGNAPVDFQDTSSVVCANCHATMNHLAPLFARFDDKGVYQMAIQVTTPINGLPKTKLLDWLPPGEDTAWRLGAPAADLPALGKAIAADPEFATCAATRIYNWAMSKDDVATDLATVPAEVIAPYREVLLKSNFQLKAVVLESFTSDDFVRF